MRAGVSVRVRFWGLEMSVDDGRGARVQVSRASAHWRRVRLRMSSGLQVGRMCECGLGLVLGAVAFSVGVG